MHIMTTIAKFMDVVICLSPPVHGENKDVFGSLHTLPRLGGANNENLSA